MAVLPVLDHTCVPGETGDSIIHHVCSQHMEQKCPAGSSGPPSFLLGGWEVELLRANEVTHAQAARHRMYKCTLRHLRLGKPMTFVGSNLASSFVCVSPDCDTGVKRPIGDGQQVIVQPGTVMATRSL